MSHHLAERGRRCGNQQTAGGGQQQELSHVHLPGVAFLFLTASGTHTQQRPPFANKARNGLAFRQARADKIICGSSSVRFVIFGGACDRCGSFARVASVEAAPHKIACGRKRELLPVIGLSSSRIDSPHGSWFTSQLPTTG